MMRKRNLGYIICLFWLLIMITGCNHDWDPIQKNTFFYIDNRTTSDAVVKYIVFGEDGIAIVELPKNQITKIGMDSYVSANPEKFFKDFKIYLKDSVSTFVYAQDPVRNSKWSLLEENAIGRTSKYTFILDDTILNNKK